ncbi:hypothetical protein L1987_53441 [Smallanthus sonchifolius]|uniref:Uncharacterized protein n=1 Tax=Smallanthus sonchifolius TaxID=185202 RepID=A0ACB9EWC1_9ASTR|nr:hypothetical protein L1987_53441 [Smallanthus sonchifolius]
MYGKTSKMSIENETRQQYQTLRYFPADNRKYCYSLNVKTRTRYLIRATFLYVNFDTNNAYPKFDISLGATHWATIVISDANTIESQELIFLASDPTVSVCLSNSTTGLSFISTLELRQFNGSVYLTPFEDRFFLSVSARINFGADNEDPVRIEAKKEGKLRCMEVRIDLVSGVVTIVCEGPKVSIINDDPLTKLRSACLRNGYCLAEETSATTFL